MYPVPHPPTPAILLCPDRYTDPQEALRTRGFLELSATALLPVLRSDKLCVDEAELVQAARSWARVGAVSGMGGRPGPQEFGKWAEGAGRHSAGAQGSTPQAVLERPVAEVAAPVVRELRLALLAPAELSALEEQNRREPFIPVRTPRGDEEPGPLPGTSDCVVTSFLLQGEQIVEAWKCHALRRGDAARDAPCRRRRGTLPRDHHRFLDLRFK